ncbi:MAG: hypothetical protein Q4G43_15015 [Mobilicoccus sp.]|nr:hypothetical protein [Mobilicoccus sp.]
MTQTISKDATVADWTCHLAGREYELSVTPGQKARVVLTMDGEVVSDKTEWESERTIQVTHGRRVRVWLSMRGQLKRATAYDGSRQLDFDAPAGSRAAQRQAWQRTHPRTYALRHVAVKGGGIVIVMLGLGVIVSRLLAPIIDWLMSLLPDVTLPELPTVPLPDVNLPQIPWPDLTLPTWALEFLNPLEPYAWIIKPLLIGLALAWYEMRRQRRQAAEREREGVDSGQ